MASDNVEFYERMQKLQAIQQQREKQRMSLEQEFNTYLKSDKRLNKVRASKLQSYWTKICEDERRSRARNEQLLREYDRVEAHVAALSARTDRLRLLKDQYEKQMEMMFPQWQEQVELRRRQQLLQQQKEQQQLAQQLQHLQQAQGRPQQQQHYQPPNQLPAQQQRPARSIPQQQLGHMTFSGYQQQQQQLQPPVQQHPSLQPMDLNGDYHRLRRTSPLVPNLHVQPNTPPIGTSEDPRYASIRFSTQPLSSLAYGTPTMGHGQPANTQAGNEFDNYEVPSTFGMSQPVLQNGSLGSQDQASGIASSGQVGLSGKGSSLQALPPNTDAGYTKLRPESQSLKSLPAAAQSSGASVYTEVRHGGFAGVTPQIEATPEPEPHGIAHSSESPGTHTASAGVSGGETRVELQQDLKHQQLAAAAQGSISMQGRQAPQVLLADDDDSIVTPLDEEDLYLEPSATESGGEKLQPKSSELLKPAERASSAVSAKAISTARTDLFTSEDDDDDDDEYEGEDRDDSTEKEALRDALQKQLNLGDAASERRQADGVQNRKEPQEQANLPKEDMLGKHNGGNQPQRLQESSAHDEKSQDEISGSDDSEIGSDISLPLSDTAEGAGPANGQKPLGKDQAASKSDQDVRPQPQVAMETVTEQGFWRLVSAVEQEIEESDNIEKIYNFPECTTAIKTEIVRTANNNGSLDHLDPNAISMVVLEQLQQIAHAMPGECLLSDKLLDTKRTITEVTIRSFLYSSALAFWDKLLQHLVLLIRKGVMDAEEVASLVAPRLIGKDSTMATKAFDVMSSILERLHEQEEDSQLDDTYSTLPSASATPSHLDTPHETRDRHQAPPEVPPLDLGDTGDHATPDLETDRVSHDSFFDEPAVPLTETKAYQQLMQSSQGHPVTSQDGNQGNSDVEEGVEGLSDDDEDDEIERATRLTPETPPSSRNKKRRNVLSSFGGSGSLGISYGDDDEDKDTRGNAGADGGATKRSEVSDLVSSPSPSPSPKGSGYVPSAMEQSLKSTGRSDPMQRSAAFWGEESDMEESEMSVPMGTGTLKSDDLKDDFDFYD
ncbi:mediator of RNA polymerase II transcription subunit 15-like [Patiria miniata]|uniref:Centrosomal protein kizuna n=1 Tax=Patiria miniata TaxID=46514 RepID=A0A914BG05_PATMI|nr:mediator of RNA polymerase II transcription subunit 15-like [Patiria miniata]